MFLTFFRRTAILNINSKGRALVFLKRQTLRQLRKLCHLSQAQLGEKVGVSASAIGMYEQGRREPDHEILCRLAEVFGVSTDYLLGEPGGETALSAEELTEEIMKNLSAQKTLMFRGGTLRREEIAELGDAVRQAVEYALSRQEKKPPRGT